MYRAFVHFDLVVLFVLIKRAGETTLFLFAGSSAWSGKKSVDHFLAASCARRAWRQSFQAFMLWRQAAEGETAVFC
jgi:hypothetical protein